MKEPVTIRSVALADLDRSAELLHALNPDAPREIVRQRLDKVLANHPHYQLVGAYVGSRLVGVAGAWIATKIWCGKYLEIDNLVVDPEVRSSGVGTCLLHHLEALARKNDCRIVTLDSYSSNHASHRLYHRLGFEIWGFHFVKPIGNWSGKPPA